MSRKAGILRREWNTFFPSVMGMGDARQWAVAKGGGGVGDAAPGHDDQAWLEALGLPCGRPARGASAVPFRMSASGRP